MKKYRPIGFALITSFLFITLCSMASFLFPMHSRVDQNIFYTLGRGIIDGRVPYRDLFEHKGPLIYFFHAFAALINRHSFVGIYLLEIAFFTVTLLFMYKTARLFTGEKSSYIAALLAGAVSCTSFCFKVGDNAEEYCFAFLMISLYYLMRYFRSADRDLIGVGLSGKMISLHTHLINYKVIFLNGILAGFVLWIKFIQLGFWIAWMGILFFVLFLQKEYKRAFVSCFVFLGGMVITALPWIIYFGLNHAIGDWLTIYFYDNIVLYAKHVTVWEKLSSLCNSFCKDFGQNPLAIFLILLGLVSFGITKKYFQSRFGRLSVMLSFLTLYIMVYIGGVRYDYYMLIAIPFTLFGTITVIDHVTSMPDMWINRAMDHVIKKRGAIAAIGLCTVIVTGYVAVAANSLPYYGKKKSDYPQYQFAEIINKKPGATLLNYGFIDGGFYLAAGIEPLPGNKFFCKVNISQKVFPEMYEEQISMVAEKKVDYVVIRIWKGQNIAQGMRLEYDDLFRNYKVISIADDPFETYRFFLLEKKDITAVQTTKY